MVYLSKLVTRFQERGDCVKSIDKYPSGQNYPDQDLIFQQK